MKKDGASSQATRFLVSPFVLATTHFLSFLLAASAPALGQTRPEPGNAVSVSSTPNPVGTHPRTDFTSTVTAPATLDTGDTVTVTGNPMPALHALNGNSIVVQGGGGIVATNLAGVGLGVVDASGNGTTVDLGTGSTIKAQGFGATPGYIGATGIRSENGAVITARDVTVSAGSDAPYGIYAVEGGTVILTGLTTITTASNGSEGSALVTSRSGGVLTAENVNITMGGVNGVYGQYQNPISAWRGSQLTVTGNAAYQGIGQEIEGVAAFYAGSTVTLNNVTGTATGTVDYATGATAVDGGTVTVNGKADLTATGAARAFGLQVIGGGAVNLLGASSIIKASAPEAYGLYVEDGGLITLRNGTVNVSGSTAAAVYSTATAATTASTVNVVNSAMTSSGDGIVVRGGVANVNFDTVTLSNDSGKAIDVGSSGSAAGTLNLMANASTLTGLATTASGSTANVTLQGGSLWTMTGRANLTSLVNNASAVRFTAPSGDPTQLASYKTLTVTNYAGTNGLIGLNTYLGADDSPSDQLVIDGGTATGTTRLAITNAGGPGAETNANGIRVVQAVNGGSTAQGAFSLASEVRGGAYDYALFRGGRDGSFANDWFLRSTFVVGPTPPTPPGPDLPVDPPPSQLPPGEYPIIGPELATYSVIHPIARQLGQMGIAELGTLHGRFGDTVANLDEESIPGTGSHNDYAWGRVFGQHVDNRYRTYTDSRASGTLAGLQIGKDLRNHYYPSGHHDAAGVYFAYGNASVNVDGLITNAALTGYELSRTGRLNLNAYSLGGYWTHYGRDDWYVDSVVKATYYDGTATTQYARLSVGGTGLIASVEGGYPIPMSGFGPSFVLEPQAQLLWQHVAFHKTDDGEGPVDLGSTSGVSGRVGVRGQWTLQDGNGVLWQPYWRVNLWKDWGGRETTTYGGDHVPLQEAATRLELAVGVTAKATRRLSLYTQAGYQFATAAEGGRRDGIQAAAGLRYVW
jgi:outer membrane autotransporter protein